MDKRLTKYCTGCGLCKSKKVADILENSKGFLYPQSGDESWLHKICPTMGNQEKFMDCREIWGKNKAVYLGWTNDTVLREKASTGGILSELAGFLLDKGMVDCVIHICANPKDPTRTQVCYSYSRTEVISRCGSRYGISHPLEELCSIDVNKKYAFIGKPCDVVVLKNYMELEQSLKNVVIYTFSFFCMGIPSVDAQKELKDRLGCSKGNCIELTYRGNGWPGFTTAIDADGNKHQMDYDSAWGHILGRDLMPACRFCIDGIGETADISCGDAWYLNENNQPDFSEHEGRNVIFARSDKGLKLLKEIAFESRITLEPYADYAKELSLIQKSQYDRRTTMYARIMALKIMQKTYPLYSNKMLKCYSSTLPKTKQFRIFLGTCRRIIKGKIW